MRALRSWFPGPVFRDEYGRRFLKIPSTTGLYCKVGSCALFLATMLLALALAALSLFSHVGLALAAAALVLMSRLGWRRVRFHPEETRTFELDLVATLASYGSVLVLALALVAGALWAAQAVMQA